MSGRQPTHNKVSALCTRLRSETKVKARREAVQDLLGILSNPRSRDALVREASISARGPERRNNLDKAWRSALDHVLHASNQSIGGRHKVTKEDVVAPFRLVAACDAEVMTRGPLDESDGSVTPAMANGRSQSKLGAKDVDALLRYTLSTLSNEEVRSVGAESDILQFLMVLCSRPDYVAHFHPQVDINYVLSEVQSRILPTERAMVNVDSATLAAKAFSNLVYQCTVALGISMYLFVRPSIEMVSDWCTVQLRRQDGEGSQIAPYLFFAASNILATHAEQAMRVMEARGSSLLRYAKKHYRNSKGIVRAALNDYISAHLLVCEVAGKLQGLLPGDIGNLGKASLDPVQIKALLKLVASEIELASLFEKKSQSSATSTRYGPAGMAGRQTGLKRKERGRARVGQERTNQRQVGARRHDGSVLWNVLTKRQRRHLELCARLIRCAQRFSIADGEMNSTDSPIEMLLLQAKERKDYGGNGLHCNFDAMLPGLEACPWIESVAVHLCSLDAGVSTNSASQSSSGSVKPSDISFMPPDQDVTTHAKSTEEQLFQAIPMLRAAYMSTARSDRNASSVAPYLQLISACAEAFPRGDCWSSNTVWSRRDDREHDASIELLYRNFSSPHDVASVVFMVTDILSTFGGASGDQHVQMWALVCLLKLTESSALVCHHTNMDSASSKVVSFVWRRLWDVIFRTDLQYRSYTARPFPGSLGELVLMLLTEITKSRLTDLPTLMLHGGQGGAMRKSSFVYERQDHIFSLPVFKHVGINSVCAFEFACMVMHHAGLCNEGQDILSDHHHHLNGRLHADAVSLSSAGRRFRLLEYCLSFVESLISEGTKDRETLPGVASVGACISALISGKCAMKESSYDIEAAGTLRITEDANDPPGKDGMSEPSSFPIWDELPLNMESHVEKDWRLQRILLGQGARLFFPSSSNDLNDLKEMRKKQRNSQSVDFVSGLTGRTIRDFVMDRMKRYLQTKSSDVDAEDSGMESDDGNEAKFEWSVNGRLLAAKVYFVAVLYSVDPNDVTLNISELFDSVSPVLNDSIENLQSASLMPNQRVAIASDLLAIFSTVISLSSTGCGAVPKNFGGIAHDLHKACMSLLKRYALRPDQGASNQSFSSTMLGSIRRNDFEDSEDETNKGASNDFRESDEDSFDSDGPSRRKRLKTSGFARREQRRASSQMQSSCERNKENDIPPDIPPDANGAWLCISIMAALLPSADCCGDVTDLVVFPEEIEPEMADCVLCLSSFSTASSIHRFQRLKQFFSQRRKSSSRHSSEEQSVLSLLCQVILQTRSFAGSSSPFYLYGLQACADAMQIAESEKYPDGIDDVDYEEVIEVLNPEEVNRKERAKCARKCMKARPYLRAAQLKAATRVFLTGGLPFHSKFDASFATKLIIPNLANISCEVRREAVTAVGAALKLLPNQKTIIDSVLKSLPPLVAKDDKTAVTKKLDKWIMERPGAGSGDLWDMEIEAWRDASLCLEWSAVQCRGIIAGCATEKAFGRAIVFELIETALVRPSLSNLCMKAVERAAILQGFSSVGDMLLDHDCEFIIREWLGKGRSISSLPFMVSSPWMAHRLLEVHPSRMLSRPTPDGESTVVSGHQQESTELDMDALQEEVLVVYCESAASFIIPTILTAPSFNSGDGAEDDRDNRWEYLTEMCFLLTGTKSDGDIAKVLRGHLHDIYAVVLPMLQTNCCEKPEIMARMGNGAFKLLQKLLSDDVISRDAAKDAHKIVRQLLWLSSKSLAHQGEIELRQQAYMNSIQYVAEKLSNSSKGGKKGLFHRAGSSTPECFLNVRQWLSKSCILVDQERHVEVAAAICSQVLKDTNEPGIEEIGLGFALLSVSGILLHHRNAHFRGPILDMLKDLATAELFEKYAKEITPVLGRIITALLEAHNTAQQEFMSQRVIYWRRVQKNIRQSIGLSIGSSGTDPKDNVWGWGETGSTLEANISYDTDLKLALSSSGKDGSKDVAVLMEKSYDILELILLHCSSLKESLNALHALPNPTASISQQKSLADRNKKFSLHVLLNDFKAAINSHKSGGSLSICDEIVRFIDLSKRYPLSQHESLSRESTLETTQGLGLGIEERSVLAGLDQLESTLERHGKSSSESHDIFEELVSVLFFLCDANNADEIRVGASRCLGLCRLDWLSPSQTLESERRGEDLLKEVQLRSLQLLSQSVQSDNVETAIVAMNTAKAMLKSDEGMDCFRTLDDDDKVALRPFIVSGKSQAKPPCIPSIIMTRLETKAGVRDGGNDKNASWCWQEELWRCPEGGNVSFEQWAKDIVTAILTCCYGKAKSGTTQKGIRGSGSFFSVCTAMCAQDYRFAAALFPAIVFDLLESDDSSEDELEQLDPVRRDCFVGSSSSDANHTLTRCFSVLLGSEQDEMNSEALGLAIDTLDSLRYATQIRFMNSKSHKMNPSPVKKSASKSRRRSTNLSSDPQTVAWKGIPFGVVLHTHGPSLVQACIRAKRYVSGLFYAEFYADNCVGGSRDIFERLSRDRADVLKNSDRLPKLDISGAATSYDDLSPDKYEQIGDVMSCTRIFSSQYGQCLLGLKETDAFRGVSTLEQVVNFDQMDDSNIISASLHRSDEDWRNLSDIDVQLQASGGNAVPSAGRVAMANQLEEMGLHFTLRTYLTGLDANPADAAKLKEKWFQDSWRALLWDDSLLTQNVSGSTNLTTSHTQNPSQPYSFGGAVPEQIIGTLMKIGAGFHESLANAFSCLIRKDHSHYSQYILQARRSLIGEMRDAVGQESLMASIPEFVCRLNCLNQLDTLNDYYFEHDHLFDLMELLQSPEPEESASSGKQLDCFLQPNVNFSSKEFSLSVKEVMLRTCSSRSHDFQKALRNHLWLTCSVARNNGRVSIAHASLHRLRQLCRASVFDETVDEDSKLTTSMRLRLEESKILYCQDDPNAVRMVKLVISTLNSATRENKDEALFSDALLLCGDWMARSKSESGKIVMNHYLKPAARMAEELYHKSSTTANGRRASHALFSLGEFVAKMFDAIQSRVRSLEWKRQGDNAKGRRKQLAECLEECKRLRRKSSEKQRFDNLALYTHVLQKEVQADEKERKAVERSVLTYLSMAVESFGKALSICDPSTCGDVSRHVFRLVSLWFSNGHRTGHDGNVNAIIAKQIVHIPSFLFVPLTYQIFSRIDKDKDAFQDTLHQIICRMSLDHPYHCIGQLVALANGDKVGTGVSGKQASMYLGNVGKSKIEAAREVLKAIKKESNKKDGRKYVASLIDSYSAISDGYIELALLPTEQFVKEKKTKGIRLSKGSTTLAHWSEEEIECPPCVLTKPPFLMPSGDYGEGSKDPVGSERILSFETTFSLTDTGLHRPKIIYCTGSKGSKYRQIVKGEDDIRQDAIMQQVFNTVNNLLKSRAFSTGEDGSERVECHDNSGLRQQELKLVTYQTIPLSPTTGVLEWVESTLPFDDFLTDKKKKPGAHSRYYPGEWSNPYCRAVLASAKEFEEKRKRFDEICQNMSPVFRFFFVEKFSHSLQAWYAARTLYTRSCAVNSIVGHILGIGDRHVHNILIHQDTGEVVHIDFGIVFEQGKVLPTPETVPFRLSRDVVDGMGPFGTEGTFSVAAEATARVLRENSGSLLTILSAVVSDPLFKWALNPMKARQLQQGDESEDRRGVYNGNAISDHEENSESANEAADRAIAKISEKLQGYEEGTSERQSVEGQVQLLINSARDPDNLCALFPGWSPWL